MSITSHLFVFADFLTPRFRMLKIFGICGVIFLCGMQSLLAADRDGTPTAVQPRDTGVLLLPALDATKDAANMQAPRQLVIRHREQVDLLTRQFKVMGDALAQKAANVSPAIDLGRLSERTSANLDLLAKRAGAEWVVHTIVEDVDADADPTGAFSVKTRVLLQVWDVRRHDWIIDYRHTGRAAGGGSPIMIFLRSLDNAVQGALANLVSAYPRLIDIEAEDGVADYLTGQTEPAVGEPGKLFQVPRVQ